ncbi:MAG: Type 1 glutamine amidotransferase-like domain-containing protein [Agathobacter sp.]|nr:Type 1 glutamine amidotransferase-like domain-containing protein [Agathobacter sp.]
MSQNITIAFSDMGCQVKSLQLANQTYNGGEIEEIVSWADIIYVGGGDTIFMMNIWKKYGLDKILKDVYQKDKAILMGISAGAICWFDCGCTDSALAIVREGATYGWANDMLNIHNYAYCPHYEDRVEDFEILMKEKNINGLAMESNTAFVEENGKVYYIKSSEDSKAYIFKCEHGTFEKEEISITLVT